MLDLPELLAPKKRVIGANRILPVSFHPLKFCIRNSLSINFYSLPIRSGELIGKT